MNVTAIFVGCRGVLIFIVIGWFVIVIIGA